MKQRFLKPIHNKAHYQAIEIDGYKWQGFWNDYHHFVKPEGKGFFEIKCTDADIEDGNLKAMIELGVSR